MKPSVLAAVALGAMACTQSPSPSMLTAPTAAATTTPSAVPAIEYRTITYAINIPDPYAAQSLIAVHPDGLTMAPVEAQRLYDFTAAYGGTPNVYGGERQPPATRTYNLAGIVIAPYDVASRTPFPASAWPNEYGQFAGGAVWYTWLGRFVYTEYHER